MSRLNAAVDALAADFARRLLVLVRRATLDDLAALRTGLRSLVAEQPRTIDGVARRWSECYSLSGAELEILRAAAEGWSRNEIARTRGVSPTTLKRQIFVLLQKTGDASLLHAVTRLLREVLGHAPRRQTRRAARRRGARA